jgi:hypothetical protein
LELDITPFRSVGLFEFDMNCEEITRVFADNISNAIIESDDKWLIITGGSLYIGFSFDAQKCCRQIRICRPSECYLYGNELLKAPTKITQALLQEHGNYFSDDYGITGSFNLCILAYKKSLDFDDIPEDIIVYRDIESIVEEFHDHDIILDWLIQILSTKFEVTDSMKKKLEAILNEEQFLEIIKAVVNFAQPDDYVAYLNEMFDLM